MQAERGRTIDSYPAPRTLRTSLTGYDLLNDARLNKGTAFTEAERDAFELHGLLPPHVGTLDEQRERRGKRLAEPPAAISKYAFMRDSRT